MLSSEDLTAHRFQLVAGHNVLDFVNTLDWRFRPSGPEDLLNDYMDLLRFTHQCGLTTARDVRRLRGSSNVTSKAEVLSSAKLLRAALAEILYAVVDQRTPKRGSVAAFSTFVQSMRRHEELEWLEYRLVSNATPGKNNLAEVPLQRLVSSAFELLSSNQLTRLGACANRECRWLFLDSSKNKGRRWCDMKLCGNRIKAKRYRQNQIGRSSSVSLKKRLGT